MFFIYFNAKVIFIFRYIKINRGVKEENLTTPCTYEKV